MTNLEYINSLPCSQRLKDNQLIAEFMGCKYQRLYVGGEETWKWGFADTHITKLWHESEFESRTPYHDNWNWLMPVVEKISKLPHVFRIIIGNINTITSIDDSPIKGSHNPAERPIESVYKSVVEFIKWYNSQNESIINNTPIVE